MNSFVVNVLDTRNHTWQGTVTWVESQRTESFRSAIELMELINSVVGTELWGQSCGDRGDYVQ